MTKANDSAFPYAAEWGYKDGLTKREYFAAMALQGLLSGTPNDSQSFYIQTAVLMADALIEELNRQS